MRWVWRNRDDTPSQDEAVNLKKERRADAALEEARTALSVVREQKMDGSLIASTLRQIRAENHFQEMWNEGLRGG